MPSKIIKITATTQEYLDNCDVWSFQSLAALGQLEVLDGAGILKIVKEAKQADSLHIADAASIDHYLAQKEK
jgi:hypothetical protein